MKLFSFKGGIRLSDEKNCIKDKAIVNLSPQKGDLMTYPLQYFDDSAMPIVEIGARVLKGQKIAEAGSEVSENIYSAVSGTVAEVKEVILPNGGKSQAIVIENDGEDENYQHATPVNLAALSKADILRRISESTVMGLGGAGLPSHAKLSLPSENAAIDYVIVNGVECQPMLTSDFRVMVEQPAGITDGLATILRVFDKAKGVIAVPSNKAEAIIKLTDASKDAANIEVAVLKPKYPQGSDRQLIKAITGREIPFGGNPADVGCIVINIETAAEIKCVVLDGEPVTSRNVTLSGDVVKHPGNYNVRLGTSFEDLIKLAGGLKENPYKILSGGPMTGVALHTLDVPITKSVTAVLCMSKKTAEFPEESACIRCARCLTHCPSGLMPLNLNKYAVTRNMEMFKADGGMNCIECGSCSYICPAKRHLTQSIQITRKTVMSQLQEGV